MKRFFKELINISAISVFILNILLGCKFSITSSSLFFSSPSKMMYDQNFYNTFQKISNNQKIINKTQLITHNNLDFWKTMIDDAFRNKNAYFLGLNKNFIKSIPLLKTELEKTASSALKFITLDYDFKTEPKINFGKLIQIKFDVIQMGFDLGYNIGKYMLVNFDNFILNNEQINISIVNYEDDELASRLSFGFKKGLFEAEKTQENSKYSFNFLSWNVNINLLYPEKSEVVYLLTKDLLVKQNLSLLFDPFALYQPEILKAFYQQSITDNQKKSRYITTINNINHKNYIVNNHNFLLANINYDFVPVLTEIINEPNNFTNKLRTEWKFSSRIINDFENKKYDHVFFDEQNFSWKSLNLL